MAKSEQPDFSQYAEMMQQTMAAALANVDALQAEAQKAREAALDELAAAREEKKRIENEAQKLAEEYGEKHRRKIEAAIREDVEAAIRREALESVVSTLIKAGRTQQEIQTWLSESPELLREARAVLGIGILGPASARLDYAQQGRGGTIVYHDERVSFTVDWEFGGGDALVLIFIPTAAQWEAATGVPLERRLPTLEFIATRVIADQGGARYRLLDGIIEILKV